MRSSCSSFFSSLVICACGQHMCTVCATRGHARGACVRTSHRRRLHVAPVRARRRDRLGAPRRRVECKGLVPARGRQRARCSGWRRRLRHELAHAAVGMRFQVEAILRGQPEVGLALALGHRARVGCAQDGARAASRGRSGRHVAQPPPFATCRKVGCWFPVCRSSALRGVRCARRTR